MENRSPEILPAASESQEASPLGTEKPRSSLRSLFVLSDPAENEGWMALGMALLYLLFFRLALLIPSDHIAVVSLTTLISLPLLVLFTIRAARAMRSPKTLLVSLLLSGLLALPSVLLPLLAIRFPEWEGWKTVGPGYGAYRRAMRSALPGLDGLLLIWFAVSLGALVSRLVREMKMLLPMAVALACVDLYVVFGGGLVAQAQSGKAPVAAQAMEALTVKLPTKIPQHGAAPMQLAVGFADFLFIALFFACFARFGIPSQKTALALGGLLIAYMLVVAFTGMALPALVPIAVVVIGMNLRRFRYERSELFALLYAALIVAAVMIGFLLFSRR